SPFPTSIAPISQLLFGLSLTTGSHTFTTLSIGAGIYWLFDLAIDRRSGGYTDVYIAGCTIFSAVFRMIAVRWLEDGVVERRGSGKEDGVSGRKTGKEVAGKEKGKEVYEVGEKIEGNAKGWVQTGLDAVELGFMNPRGVGWNFQLRNLPPTPARDTPRLPFVAKHLVSAAIDLLLVDLSYYHLRHNSPIASLPIRPLTSQPFPLALFNAWLIYLQARWTMNALHSILAAITVPMHIFSPAGFPPLFGSFKHAYTIKGFWSHTWHQMMRTLALPYTNALVRTLHLNPSQKSTYWVKVSSAFFWAWAVHAYGTLIAGGGYGGGEKIRVEGKRLEDRWICVGVLLPGATLIVWFGPAVRMGAHLKGPLPWSFVEWVVAKM
ncbi:unnamed protein product, partial [Aureobasidium pullulans]